MMKQSPRQWNKRFGKFMMKNDFAKSNFDSCIYFKKMSNGCFIYLLLYVDDILIACKNLIEIQKLKVILDSEFEMKDLGPAKKILGMEIRRDRVNKKLVLSQEGYLKKVWNKFGMKDVKAVLTPLSSQLS